MAYFAWTGEACLPRILSSPFVGSENLTLEIAGFWVILLPASCAATTVVKGITPTANIFIMKGVLNIRLMSDLSSLTVVALS